jgi:hypothetical protein
MKTVNLEKLLPSDIPQGERILWHGRPEWVSLARRAFRADLVAAYFAVMTLYNYASVGFEAGVRDGAISAAKTLLAAFAAIALLSLLAWLTSRTTLYVVTTRRLVMKIGIALPTFFNLPFSQIASASLRVFPDGTGDIPVAVVEGQHIAYLHLWPHARPFRLKRPEPALRCVPRAADIAAALSRALVAAAEERTTAAASETVGRRVGAGEAVRPAGQAAAA